MVGTNTKTQDILAGVDLSAFDSIGESILADPSAKSSSSSNSAAASPSVTPQPGGPSSSPAPNPVALTEASGPGSRAKSVDKGKVKEKESKGGFASFFKTKFLGGLAGANSATTENNQTAASAAAAATAVETVATNTQSELAQSTTTATTTTATTELLGGEQSNNGVSLSNVKRSTSVKSIKATSTLARKAAASPDNMDSNPSSLTAASSSFMDLGKSAFASLLRKPRSETPVEDDLLDEVASARKTIPRKPTIPKAEGKTSSTRRSAENLDDNVTVPSLARSPSAMRTLPRKQTSKGQSTSENVNIEDQAKDGIMTLLRSASLKRSVSVKANASAAATPQAASINLASAKAALKAEFNKPSLASLQAELAVLRGEDPEPAPWFLAPGKKKGLAAAAEVTTPDDATPKATGGKADSAGN
ncbi:hypothetical protein CcCBS67573_g10312 [Chytriomyces confervae]|uniref:Uncharacterized protein n=1 Tax=Chytriomyces confervae TaxID=246404 RepID=A0A507D5H0_9FUNG|nr:hypothetical protein CcCBS67573_g10312 [Chytriomyces confervae]